MKRILKVASPFAITCCLYAPMAMTSCSDKTMYSKPKHIVPYLHEITYDDYRYDINEETTKGSDDASFGCSSVRKGNLYGRNFDYVFNDTPEFVVHVKANEKKHRHESIGVATHFGLREQKFLDGKYGHKDIELIPNLTLDGINDAGLICSHNVVSMEAKTSDDIIPETNPGAANKLHQLFVPRYILDNADDVDDAIGLLTNSDLNIHGSLNETHFLHIMIADANKTMVIEFFHKDNSNHNHFDVVYDEKNNIDIKGEEPIMTNYYVNNYKKVGGEYQDNYYFTNDRKNGDERFEILKDGYKSVDSVASMRNLMQKVKYSNSCSFTHNPVPMNVHSGDDEGNLNSEWYSETVPQSDLYPSRGDPFNWEKAQEEIVRPFKEAYWKAIIDDERSVANPDYWITTHNSTYDMSTKTLTLSVQENYLKTFTYSL